MFPIRDDNPQILTPFVTYGIIGLNVLAWVVVQGLGSDPALARSICTLGLIPDGDAAGWTKTASGGASEDALVEAFYQFRQEVRKAARSKVTLFFFADPFFF